MPRATLAGFAWASAAPILVLVACGGSAIDPSPSVENDAASAGEAGVDAGGRDAPALPADAGLAEILYARTFTYWARRKWDRVAYPVTHASDPIPENAYVPIAPEPHYIVRFSADGLSTTLTPVPDGGAPALSLSGVRKTASEVSATYEDDYSLASFVFAVSVGSGLPAAKVTIKGSGVPIIYATAGELRD
jgi:hypothetical protein